MGMRELEAAVLRELVKVTGLAKLRQKDILEWTTGEIKGSVSAGEARVFLPELKVQVVYRVPPEPKRKRPIAPVLALLLALAAPAAASPINLIANGDFGLGAVGFETDYTITATNTDEGQIRAAATVAEWGHPLFVDFAPAAGAAAMLLVNGATDTTRRVWAQTVAVEPGASYVWSAALAGLCCIDGYPMPVPSGRVLFAVDGVGLLVASPEGRGHWSAVGAAWTAAGPSARLEVFDLEPARNGNDWAMTLLALTPAQAPPAAVPEPSTAALVATGALWALRCLWRARRAA